MLLCTTTDKLASLWLWPARLPEAAAVVMPVCLSRVGEAKTAPHAQGCPASPAPRESAAPRPASQPTVSTEQHHVASIQAARVQHRTRSGLAAHMEGYQTGQRNLYELAVSSKESKGGQTRPASTS